jgi:hypothetical protein
VGFLSTVVLSALGILACVSTTQAQSKAETPPEQTSRVTIEVSGGEKEAPVENASVYIKYVEERKIRRDKKLELNVKTNRDGTAHVPGAPMGRVSSSCGRMENLRTLVRYYGREADYQGTSGEAAALVLSDPSWRPGARKSSLDKIKLHRNSAKRIRILTIV